MSDDKPINGTDPDGVPKPPTVPIPRPEGRCKSPKCRACCDGPIPRPKGR